jgi:RHS repeat-associated protein
VYTYDGLGRLKRRLDYTWSGSSWYQGAEIRYFWDGWLLVQERNGTTPVVSYTRGHDLSGSREGAGGIGGLLGRSTYASGAWGNHAFYHADANGNVTMLLRADQTHGASYKYDPFGRTISSSGPLATANTMRFSSKEWHEAAGIYYYGYRFYRPEWQRWLSRDPIGERGGNNLYSLLQSDSINRVDILGLAELDELNRVIKVDRCEIVIFYGHQHPKKPWTFEFNGFCTGGAAITCWPTLTNSRIPSESSVPGAPTHDETTYFYGEDPNEVSKEKRKHRDPETDFDYIFPVVLEGAIKKAGDLCSKNCCKQVRIVFVRYGSLIPGDKVPPLKNNLIVDCATHTVKEVE